MKKRINLKDWTYVGKYNHAAKWCRSLCSYYLIKENDKIFKRVQKVNIFIYILIFIPLHLLQALVLLWDGGLREFIIFSRYLGTDTLVKGSESFTRAETIWNDKTCQSRINKNVCIK
jgi:hypothetical protein